MNFILIAVIVLGAIALVASVVLYAVSKKFAVKEDPRVGQVLEVLPGANCGGCGFAGSVTTPEFVVDGKATLTFRAVPWDSDNTHHHPRQEAPRR